MTSAIETAILPCYWVCTARAKMPSSCMGGSDYYRVAIVRTEDGSEPRIIRDSHNQTVVETWERLFSGKTDNCARARAEAEALERAIKFAKRDNCDFAQR